MLRALIASGAHSCLVAAAIYPPLAPPEGGGQSRVLGVGWAPGLDVSSGRGVIAPGVVGRLGRACLVSSGRTFVLGRASQSTSEPDAIGLLGLSCLRHGPLTPSRRRGKRAAPRCEAHQHDTRALRGSRTNVRNTAT